MRFEREQLSKPPLVEALVELRARHETPYAAVFGGMFAAISHQFPTVEDLAPSIGVGPDGVQPTPVHRFRSKDGMRLIQTGPHLLTVNVLGDYGRFEDFEELLRFAFEAFVNAARPHVCDRIGVRYINHIDESLYGTSDPLTVKTTYPGEVVQRPAGIAMRAIFDFPKSRGQLGLATSFPTEVKGRRGCLIDLDFFAKSPAFASPGNMNECLDWIRVAHDEIYQVFRAVIAPDVYKKLR